MRVNVVGQSNGVGLSRDLSLLAAALRACGCTVVVTALTQHDGKRRRAHWVQWLSYARRWWHIRAKLTPQFDVVVMMEHIWPEQAVDATHVVAIPNPEWFDRHDLRCLGLVTQVWAKTYNTQKIFKRHSRSVTQVGFDSEDRLDESVPRQQRFFHLAGRSTMKGTSKLLDIWRRHPEWPTLTVVQDATHHSASINAATNIELLGFLDDAQLRELQNTCLFHVCTSETEGWGHYLVEALSVGAITITLDAPPMNELVSAERGYLLPAHQTRQQKLAACYTFDERDLELAVVALMSATDMQLQSWRNAARQWFVDNKHDFPRRLQLALQGLSNT